MKTTTGYIHLLLKPKDPLFCMTGKTGYVFEHRYLVAKKLGRPLKEYEIIHHINGKKDDNRMVNLELIGGKKAQIKHNIITKQQKTIEKLKKKLEKYE